MSRHRALPICLLACLVLPSACGPAPRPFHSEAGTRNELLVLADRAGILVAPISGDLPGDPDRLAEAMAVRLRLLNVPATTRTMNGESRVLQGWAGRRPLSGRPAELVVEWELWDRKGHLIGGYTQHRPDAPDALPIGGAALIEALADEAAPKIAALVQAPPEVEAGIPGFPGARLVVPPLDAGPGDSARSLILALRAELAAAGLPLAQRAGPDDMEVRGNIALEPAGDGQQEVTIAWALVRVHDGFELGRVDQRNRVPDGSLDGAWGALAEAVARGAAEGVIGLLARIPR